MDSPPAQNQILSHRQQRSASLVLVVCVFIMSVNWGLKWFRNERTIDIERPFESRKVELLIDLNHASWPELTLLPEISETMARRIVDHRDVEGPFLAVEEIEEVRGIGPRTLEQVLPYLKPIGMVVEAERHPQ